ncbi:hypothetical protein PAXRUDRAFT_19545 [Paxillus rubicundulus Ve08.2h10]|uniref:Uncharacterized protein n=1 Tax=Paxillus rubicundulus Ve08.2h10 TaxID=930991 RepID=A0A0D0CHU3_9AGAM|nr:hypothetical protein PAXRUDRAFT_19545 [Paxillus rubicundulus Ve08.2h10]
MHMNTAITRKLAAIEGVHMHRPNMQIGCTAHVLNLVAQALGHGLGNAPDPDEEDLYKITHQFPLAYNPETDPEVMQDMSEMLTEQSKASEDDSDAWSSDSSESDDSGLSDKLHTIIVDILASEVRRKCIRRMIHKLCTPANRHLVPIQSMPIRWNTTYAEIDRGIKLKPAINRWIDQLDQHLTGKKRKAAMLKKKKWHLSPGDWDFLEHFAAVLVASAHTIMTHAGRS